MTLKESQTLLLAEGENIYTLVRLEASVKLHGKPLTATNTSENCTACPGVRSRGQQTSESRRRGIPPQILEIMREVVFSWFKTGDNSELRFLLHLA